MLVDTIVDKKGSDIALLDIRDQAVFADYFLICNGENERQLNALAETIRDKAKQEAKVIAYGVEGAPQSGWMLVDFGDLIVHIFSPNKRTYYDLEGLWIDAHVVPLKSLSRPSDSIFLNRSKISP